MVRPRNNSATCLNVVGISLTYKSKFPGTAEFVSSPILLISFRTTSAVAIPESISLTSLPIIS